MRRRCQVALAIGVALTACSGAKTSKQPPDDLVTVRSALTTVSVTVTNANGGAPQSGVLRLGSDRG
jgi:hypothetical protein